MSALVFKGFSLAQSLSLPDGPQALWVAFGRAVVKQIGGRKRTGEIPHVSNISCITKYCTVLQVITDKVAKARLN